MIISHEHRFIFFRTEKTAGSSIEFALAKYCGPTDIVTSGGAKAETLRGLPLRKERPRWVKHIPFRTGNMRRILPQYFGLHTHATARHVKKLVGDNVFRSYFKFCVERNPWDRQVSLYFQRNKRSGNENHFDRDMRSFIFRTFHYTRMKNWQTYTIDGRIAVDRVLRYERLEEELSDLLKTINLPDDLRLPSRRSEFRTDGRSYREFYSKTTRELVAKWYRKEIEAFGYAF